MIPFKQAKDIKMFSMIRFVFLLFAQRAVAMEHRFAKVARETGCKEGSSNEMLYLPPATLGWWLF